MSGLLLTGNLPVSLSKPFISSESVHSFFILEPLKGKYWADNKANKQKHCGSFSPFVKTGDIIYILSIYILRILTFEM